MYKILICKLIFLLILSCGNKKTENNKKFYISNDTIVSNKTIEKVLDTCEKNNFIFEEKENEVHRSLKFKEISLTTFFEHETTYLSWKGGRPYVTNFVYSKEVDQEDSGIMLFNCNSNYSILVLSVFTEEFPTYQLIKLEDSGDVLFLGDFTMSIDNFEKIYGEKEVSYFITTDKKGEILLHSKGSKGKLLGRYDEKVNNNPIETLEKTTPKVDTYLNIRSSKDLSTSEVVGMIPKGKEFFILNTFDKWSLVYFEGVYGYVNNEFVR